MPLTAGRPLPMPVCACRGSDCQRREAHEREEWRGAGLSHLYHTVLGVKDSTELASPALQALHLALVLHSYWKISTDLPSCAGMALMEWGPLIRDGRAAASVFGS